MKKYLIVFILCLSGCYSQIVLHPINKSDIFRIEKGYPVGNSKGEIIQTEKSGYFMSDDYLKEILDMKVKQ